MLTSVSDTPQNPSAPTPAPVKARLTSLDVFRGLTIAAMLVVNTPGSWQHVYPPLRHAEWHGCTFTDLVFPFFLFAVGLSMAFSKRLGGGPAHTPGELAKTYLGVLKRAAILIGLGLLLNAASVLVKDPIDFSRMRLPGVLQRIGVCYLLASMVVLHLPRVWQWLVGGGILVGSWFLLSQVPVPGFEDPASRLSPSGNLVAHIDQIVIGPARMYTTLGAAHDPEGLLSTLPALVTTLLGFWTGIWLRSRPRDAAIAGTLALVGLAAMVAGWLWSLAGLPLNKNLWTSSYVLFTAGWALLMLAACWLACEVLGSRRDRWRWVGRALWPMEVMGLNAILAFVGSGLLVRAMGVVKIDGPAGPVALPRYLFTRLVDTGLAPIDASLVYALLALALWWGVLWVCYRCGWFWKV